MQTNNNEELQKGRANYFERAFPCIFPYGEGGIEGNQEVALQFSDHIRWVLRYHDRRFRKHETFPFIAFGIQQRREVLLSARLQMEKRTFERDARILSTITCDTLRKALEDEENGRPLTDAAVRLLRQHIQATAARVTGSSLWLTINPCDLHDPIAQVFAGEHIDLDNFNAQLGPYQSDTGNTVWHQLSLWSC